MTQKKQKEKIKNNWWLVLIIILACFFRFWRIEVAPIAILPDEMDYILSAKAIFYHHGGDLSNQQKIWQLKPFLTGTAMAELGPLFQFPIMSWLPINMLTVKIMPFVFSLLLVLGVYFFCLLLFNDEKLGLVSALVLAINPWAIFIGRTAYEAPIALTLYIWSYCFLVLIIRQNKKRYKNLFYLISWFILFFWAFFTYHGLKIAGVLITLIIALYLVMEHHLWRQKTALITLLSACLIVMMTLSFNALSLLNNQIRTNELNFLQNEIYQNEAKKQKQLNLIPNNFLSKVLDHHQLIFMNSLINKWFEVYDFKQIFISGFKGWSNSLSSFGQFYSFESIIFFLSLYFLLRYKKYLEFFLLGSCLFVAPASYVMSVDSDHVALQASFIIVIMAISLACGYLHLYQKIKQSHQLLFIGFIVGAYLFSGLFWSHNYFNRFILYGEEQFFFKERLLSHYLNMANTEEY